MVPPREFVEEGHGGAFVGVGDVHVLLLSPAARVDVGVKLIVMGLMGSSLVVAMA